ncbi:MAG: endonuclease III [Clostridia bacterium]
MDKFKYLKLEKKYATDVVSILAAYYKNAKCGLDYTTPFSLTVALILAAQNTDKSVNIITPIFFEKFKNISDVANAKLSEIEKIIKPCGFYVTKAKYIKETAKQLENISFPSTMEELLKLHGIGRKSANIILQECFNTVVGIAVDTHVTRLSYRIGLSEEILQEKIEKDLMKIYPKNYYPIINHIFVYHGREICMARNPKCDICPISHICKKNNVIKK